MGVKINSRAKGARGERELADEFVRVFGCDPEQTYRGCQFKGGKDSPDIVSDLEFIHPECKFVERLNVYKAMEQAVRDSGPDRIPTVFHRKKRKPWLVIVRLDDLPEFVRQLASRLTERMETTSGETESSVKN